MERDVTIHMQDLLGDSNQRYSGHTNMDRAILEYTSLIYRVSSDVSGILGIDVTYNPVSKCALHLCYATDYLTIPLFNI